MDNISGKKQETSFCLSKLIVDDKFVKELNTKKIELVFNGNYVELFNYYYDIISKIIYVNKVYGITYYDGEIYEISKLITEDRFVEYNTSSWIEILTLFKKIMEYINKIDFYNQKHDIKIGIDSSIWNFTKDGMLFDLDPPKVLCPSIDTSFTRLGDKDHYDRTIYRGFDEIGLKVNALVTYLICERITTLNRPDDYKDILVSTMTDSMNLSSKKKFLFDFDNLTDDNTFKKHPILLLKKKLYEE